jgi:hypothetical protein
MLYFRIDSEWPKIDSSDSLPVKHNSRSLNSIGSMNSVWRNQSDASILSMQESESSSSSNQYNDGEFDPCNQSDQFVVPLNFTKNVLAKRRFD